ncbi:GPI mannosyltransferase 1 [Epargyreus clarus]|uniref:GPI mannosyltransferase 1 n=1 Tax=Epargyreus clarus TaxID=520877 RepID=UPI003C2F1282
MVFTELKDKTVRGITQFGNLPIGYHLIFGFCIRLLLILYADYHDAVNDVKYTDVDYKVFTDAARLVLRGESPFDRHTYRYSPIFAWLLVPNIVFNENFGKVLFSAFDIMITFTIKSFVQRQLKGRVNAGKIAKFSSMFWLYNPLSIGISTRGSADSISCFVILLAINFLQYYKIHNDFKFVLSGMFLGIAIHLRLYPIIFSFPMYLSLGDYRITRNTTIREGLIALIPNKKQIILTLTTIVYFAALTYSMYLMYGYKFIFETYIYHLFRKDTKHNFSLFFYTSYLTMTDGTIDLIKFTAQICVFIIFLMLSLAFGCESRTLPFALFCQAVVLVSYNSVVTSQYFVWYLSLLPLIVHDIKMNIGEGIFLIVVWVNGQISWLIPAYFIEFENYELFMLLSLMCLFFFVSNIVVLMQIITYYYPGHGFGFANVSVRAKNK